MKPILLGLVTVGVIGSIVYFVPNTETVENTVEVNTATSTEKVDLDVIEEANKELERINAELDAEESRLLDERDSIDARLEKILETRQSFQ